MLPVTFTPTAPPTDSLIEAATRYEKYFQHVRTMERSTARRILNAVDLNVPTGPARDAIRQEVLDGLAAWRRDMLKWVQSESSAVENPSTFS